MNKKLEAWFYGGQSKAFYIEQGEAIHQHNTKMADRLLVIMTIIVGVYLVMSMGSPIFSKYGVVYYICFIVLFSMLVVFKLKKQKSVLFTKIHIFLFSCVMLAFVCTLGTVFTPESRASLFIVYVLTLPMLLVIPTHYMYGFLSVGTLIFSIMSLSIKDLEYAIMDVTHGVTCLVIGIFVSHRVLESRIALYVLNDQLDTRNVQLDRQLHEKEAQLLQSRISILLSQIQPHFLYNTLTVICGLCDENPKEAKKVTVAFADYLRHNLNSLSQRDPVPFLEELQHTKLYLGIEKKRFQEKLQVVYDIETEQFRIPPLTVQPLAENAVKHGVLKRKSGGKITITTREQMDCYEISIEDNGVGFNPEVPQLEPHVHVGIENVRTRLGTICHGTLTIVSKESVGTVATIRIPKDSAPCE